MTASSKPLATLMAMSSAHLPRKPTRGPGGSSPMESGMNAQLNNGMGHGHNFFSTTPLMGHAMSGTQLGQADNAIRQAQKRFAEGGKVAAKPKGPSLKERKEIRAMIERGKGDAVDALRETRATLNASMPAQTEPEDFDVSLERLRTKLAAPMQMADGGAVEEPEEAPQVNADPNMLYQEYTELLSQLEDPALDQSLQMEIVDRLAELEGQLEALGITLPTGEAPPPE